MKRKRANGTNVMHSDKHVAINDICTTEKCSVERAR